jgi:hypothetical protein
VRLPAKNGHHHFDRTLVLADVAKLPENALQMRRMELR